MSAERVEGPRRSGLGPLLVVAGGALAIRLAYALLLAPDVSGIGDDVFYRLSAQQLADGLGYVSGLQALVTGEQSPTATHPPLYPLAVSGLIRLGAESLDAQRLVGVAAGTVTVLVIGLLARRLGGSRAGIAAAAMAAVYPVFIAADGAIMSESLFGALVACALLLTLRLLDHPSPAATVLLGLTLGAAALTRSEGLLLVPLLAVPLVVATPARRLRTLAALVAAAAVAVAPWVARNWHEFGEPVFTTNEGTTLAGANCDLSYFGDGIGGFTTRCLGPIEPGLDEAERNRYRRRQAWRYIRSHERRAATVVGVRVLRLWGLYDPLDQTNLDGRDRSVQEAGFYAFYLVLAGGIAGGVALWRRGRRLELAVLLAPVAVATATAIATYGLLRLRHIADVSLLALAGLALSRVRRRRAPARA